MKKYAVIVLSLFVILLVVGCPWKPPKNEPPQPPPNNTNTTPPAPTCQEGWFCNGSIRYYQSATCEEQNSENCPNGCTNGTCLPANNESDDGDDGDDEINQTDDPQDNETESPISCTDTDLGLAYPIAGTVTVTGQAMLADECINSSVLKEYSCGPDNSSIETQYRCGDGCVNGACSRTPLCEAEWVCNNSIRYFQNPDCSRSDEVVCENGCFGDLCRDVNDGGGDDPPINETEPPVNETEPPVDEPPVNETEPPVNDTGGPQDQTDI